MKTNATKRISRRRFGGAVAGMAVAAGPAAARPQPQSSPTREEELTAALARNRVRAKDLDDFELPMMTEPAFVFEA